MTYLLSVQVPLPHFHLWPFSSGWWRYLHHPRRWWRYLHHLRGYLTNIISSSLQYKIKHSIIPHYTTQHSSNSIKRPAYHGSTHEPANVDRIPCPTIERTTNKLKCKTLDISSTTIKYIQEMTSNYNNLCAQLQWYIVYNDNQKHLTYYYNRTPILAPTHNTNQKHTNKQHTN